MLSKFTILNVISEKRTSDIFKCIASARLNTEILISKLKLTRKQYYSRLSLLTKAGMVKRLNGRYHLTEFGKVIYSAEVNLESKIESAVNNYWKLKAIDLLQISSAEERKEIISALIDNQEIKGVLLSEEPEAANKQNGDVHNTLLTVPNYI